MITINGKKYRIRWDKVERLVMAPIILWLLYQFCVDFNKWLFMIPPFNR